MEAVAALITNHHALFTTLRIQRDLQFVGKLIGIKRAAREIAPVELERGHLAKTVVHAQAKLFRTRRLINIHFAKCDAALAQKILRAATIATPLRAINRKFSHFRLFGHHENERKAAFILTAIGCGGKCRDSMRVNQKWTSSQRGAAILVLRASGHWAGPP